MGLARPREPDDADQRATHGVALIEEPVVQIVHLVGIGEPVLLRRATIARGVVQGVVLHGVVHLRVARGEIRIEVGLHGIDEVLGDAIVQALLERCVEHVAVAVRHVGLHVVDAFEHLEPATADQRVAASIGGFLEHHHIQALLGRGDGGGHAGAAGAAHHEICLDLLGLLRLLRRRSLLQRRSVSVRLVDAISHALDDGHARQRGARHGVYVQALQLHDLLRHPLASRSADALGFFELHDLDALDGIFGHAHLDSHRALLAGRGRRIRPRGKRRGRGKSLSRRLHLGSATRRHESSLGGGNGRAGDKRPTRQ